VRRRLDSGQHVALVVGDGKSGDGLGDPVIGRVLGEESGRLTSGQRRLGDVRRVAGLRSSVRGHTQRLTLGRPAYLEVPLVRFRPLRR
jgi:hypothetical protein